MQLRVDRPESRRLPLLVRFVSSSRTHRFRIIEIMEILCTDCDYLVDRGVRIAIGDDQNCCRRDLPIHEASAKTHMWGRG